MRRARLLLACTAAVSLVLGFALPANAGNAWDEIRGSLFAERTITPAGDLVHLEAPFRPLDQRATPIDVEAKFADGRSIRAVTLIVDENPSPVAARFEFGGTREHVHLSTKLRLNAATDVRAIVEASDGQLYMAQRFVRFAGGQAACSAPPSGSPEQIAATMGNMTLEPLSKQGAATQIEPRARLKIMHPNHTGMVLDQLTLLYVPLRILTDVEVRQGDERVFSMQGSMTLAQDPVIDFDYRTNGATALRIDARDSDGAGWSQVFPIGQGS
ncbi:sulfur-oxidizing protein SoxY [Hyphomicrobium sp. 1Nfss2.1]|uniref:quinoprotein dehydrogenase-associated SoxYZ-like carrier n=1 Tax=Hyphomicrobium sp. 1Nfss2.1 TaxID=3413936 RepID=UPI003C7D8C21